MRFVSFLGWFLLVGSVVFGSTFLEKESPESSCNFTASCLCEDCQDYLLSSGFDEEFLREQEELIKSVQNN